MWKSFVTFLLFVTPALALAEEQATAYEALRVVGTQFGRGALNHLVSITGVEGNPQPEKWKIMLEDPTAMKGRVGSLVRPKRGSEELSIGHRMKRRACSKEFDTRLPISLIGTEGYSVGGDCVDMEGRLLRRPFFYICALPPYWNLAQC